MKRTVVKRLAVMFVFMALLCANAMPVFAYGVMPCYDSVAYADVDLTIEITHYGVSSGDSMSDSDRDSNVGDSAYAEVTITSSTGANGGISAYSSHSAEIDGMGGSCGLEG